MPIHYALFYPDAAPSGFGALNLSGRELTFHPVDEKKYRMLSLAYQAAENGGAYPAVYNAANEIAVGAFISGIIPFTGIPWIVEQTLEKEWEKIVSSIDDILAFDKAARIKAKKSIIQIGRKM